MLSIATIDWLILFISLLFPAYDRSLCALVACCSEWVTALLHSAFWIFTEVVLHLQRWFRCYMAGATWNCSHHCTRSVYTIQPCTSLQYYPKPLIRKVHVWLAVTCHLHFWQNDRDLLGATAVTRGWNGYRNESWSTLETQILPPLLPGIKPATLRSWVQ